MFQEGQGLLRSASLGAGESFSAAASAVEARDLEREVASTRNRPRSSDIHYLISRSFCTIRFAADKLIRTWEMQHEQKLGSHIQSSNLLVMSTPNERREVVTTS